MRLVKCYINNFGCLSDKEFIFDKNFNPYLRENGEGKTTLSEFIKSMLYGMDTYTSKTVGIPARKHYIPLNGKAYGGSLTIEYKNKIYRIEREFDDKSKTSDKLKIYDDKGYEINKIENQIVDKDFSVGNYFLGIDKDAFSKCNFIYSGDLTFKINDSIKLKLNNILISSLNDNTYSDVISKIDEDLKRNRKGTKKYGQTDKDNIEILKALNEEYNSKLKSISLKEKELNTSYSTYNELNSELNALIEKNKDIIKEQIKSQSFIELKQKKEKLKKYDESYNNIINKYPKGFINNNDFYFLKKYKDDLFSPIDNLKKYKLTENDTNFLNDYKKYQNELTDSFISNLDSKYNKLELLNEQKEDLNRPNIAEYNELKIKYQGLNFEKLTDIYKEFQNYNAQLNALPKDAKKEVIVNDKNEASKLLTDYNTTKEKIDSIKLISFTFITFLLCIITLGIYYLIWNNKKAQEKKNKDNLIEELDNLAKKLDDIFDKYEFKGNDYNLKYNLLVTLNNQNTDEKLNIFNIIKEKEDYLIFKFKKYGINNSNIDDAYNIFYKAYSSYVELDKKVKDYNLNLESLDNKIKEVNNDLDSKINKYINNDLSIPEKIQIIKNDYKKYNEISNKAQEHTKANKTYNDIKSNIKSILNNYSIELEDDFISQFDNFSNDKKELDKYKENIKELNDEITRFISENNLSDFKERDYQNEKLDIEKNIDLLKNNIKSYSKAIDSLEEQIGEKDELKASIDENLGKIKKLEYEDRIKSKTRELIVSAWETLENKYLAPIKNKFSTYASMIKEEFGNEPIMNFDYEISYERSGHTINSDYFSDGEKTIIMLALRLAVIDQMYEDDDSFIILDDPFVYLDDINLKKAIHVVKQLTNKQIIYFTCHESRQ